MLGLPDLPRRPRRLRRAAVPAAVAAILVVPAALARTTAPQQPDTAAVASIPASPAATSGTPTPVSPVPARPVLLALADRLADAPADTAPGAYSYIETRSWANVNGLTGPIGSSMTFVQVVHYQQLWRDGHGNGRMTVMDETSGCEIESGSGSWSGNQQREFFGPPAVTDPVKLRQQLLAGSGPSSPGSEGVSLTGGVAGTAERETLRRPVRAAMLQLLADIPGLLVRQPVTDRAGRPGIDVILPYLAEQSTPTEHTLTFDPATGVLLASSYRLTGPSASSGSAQTDQNIAMFRASFDNAYRLYLTSTFTPTSSAPAPACVPVTSSPAR
ncbi:CU044_5270 family protein [Dactylosporangium sp. NPDC051485]|uniref:CU044_5270 family protein n=1 Tax=Dactylosporangium sp. NPDC051485 TaxID=3154846 RepID=UPI0034451344